MNDKMPAMLAGSFKAVLDSELKVYLKLPSQV